MMQNWDGLVHISSRHRYVYETEQILYCNAQISGVGTKTGRNQLMQMQEGTGNVFNTDNKDLTLLIRSVDDEAAECTVH